jgi:hypothetical protein
VEAAVAGGYGLLRAALANHSAYYAYGDIAGTNVFSKWIEQSIISIFDRFIEYGNIYFVAICINRIWSSLTVCYQNSI